VVIQGGKPKGDMSVTRRITCLFFCGGPKPVVSNVLGAGAKKILKMFAGHIIYNTYIIYFFTFNDKFQLSIIPVLGR